MKNRGNIIAWASRLGLMVVLGFWLAGCAQRTMAETKAVAFTPAEEKAESLFKLASVADGTNYARLESELLEEPALRSVLARHANDADPLNRLMIQVFTKAANGDRPKQQKWVDYFNKLVLVVNRTPNSVSHFVVAPVLWRDEGANVCDFLALEIAKNTITNYYLARSVMFYVSKCRSPDTTSALLHYSIQRETEIQRLLAGDTNLAAYLELKSLKREANQKVFDATKSSGNLMQHVVASGLRDYAIQVAEEIGDKDFRTKLAVEMGLAEKRNLSVPKTLRELAERPGLVLYRMAVHATGENYVKAEEALLDYPEVRLALRKQTMDMDPINQLMIRVVARAVEGERKDFQGYAAMLETMKPSEQPEDIGERLWQRAGTNACEFLALRLVKETFTDRRVTCGVLDYLKRCQAPETVSAIVRYGIQAETKIKALNDIEAGRNNRTWIEAQEKDPAMEYRKIHFTREPGDERQRQEYEELRDKSIVVVQGLGLSIKDYSTKVRAETSRATAKGLGQPRAYGNPGYVMEENVWARELYKALGQQSDHEDSIKRLYVILRNNPAKWERHQHYTDWLGRLFTIKSPPGNPGIYFENIAELFWEQEGDNLCEFMALDLVLGAFKDHVMAMEILDYLAKCKSPHTTDVLIDYAIQMETEWQKAPTEEVKARRDLACKIVLEVKEWNSSKKLAAEIKRAQANGRAVPRQFLDRQ